ncbi:MAG: hypothetical protein II744_05355 [Eubacterium sp.]|nr:hypothetical protein [Eubacterium sp.]
MVKVSLNGEYELHNLKDGAFICNSSVPGSDFGAYLNAGMLSLNDAYFEETNSSFSEKDVYFERTFMLDDITAENIILHFERLDTVCDIYLNGNLVAKTENAHIFYDFDVKKYVNSGENKLKIIIYSPVNYIVKRQKENPLPKNVNGTDGAAYIRKPACNFGWDWGPCVPYKYIGSVELKMFTREIKLNAVKQVIHEGRADLTVIAENADEMLLVTPDGKELKPDGNTFEVINPELWYPRDLNLLETQPLYTLVLKNNEEVIERKIGIRTVELNTEKDEYGTNFQLVVNGKRVFAKGGNLIPFSAIPEQADEKTVDYYLGLAVKANFNILRVWGGGEYANEYLLSRCDELGILVWQDFAYACLMYPFYEEIFLYNVLNEAKQNVCRQSLHPCVALFCGNNELEDTFSWIPKNLKITKSYVDFFYNKLPEQVKKYTDISYIPTSPLGSAPFENNGSDEVGDTHIWNVWHGMQPPSYFGKRYTRFLSEFGLEALPSMKAVKTFADKSAYSLDSKEFSERQKCNGGNGKILVYLKQRFDEPESFEDMPYLTGIVQAECIRAAAEHFRRNKGRCNGTVFWQFNDVWNCPSWSSVDFEGVPKALQYMAEEFFAPVALTYNGESLYLHNDTLYDKKLSVTVDGVEYETLIKSDSVKKLIDFTVPEGSVCKVTLDGRDYYFDNNKPLEKAEFEVSLNGNKMTVKSNTFAKNIFVEAESVSDINYFSLLDGEEKTLTFGGEIGDYRILCENNIRYITGNFKKAAKHFAFRLKPWNVVNEIYYRFK